MKSSIIYCELSIQDCPQPFLYLCDLVKSSNNPVRQVLLQVKVRGFMAISLDQDMLCLQSVRTSGRVPWASRRPQGSLRLCILTVPTPPLVPEMRLSLGMEREVGLPLRRHSGSGTSGEMPLRAEEQKGQTCRGSLTHELSIGILFNSFVSGLHGRCPKGPRVNWDGVRRPPRFRGSPLPASGFLSLVALGSPLAPSPPQHP